MLKGISGEMLRKLHTNFEEILKRFEEMETSEIQKNFRENHEN